MILLWDKDVHIFFLYCTGCSNGLQRLALSRRECDGIPDCAGAEDERSCAHCSAAGAGGLRCALHTRCLPPHLRCDGTPDCPDGSDEAGCRK